MKIHDIHPQFKRFAIHERAITSRTIREMINVITRYTKHTNTLDVENITTDSIREFLYYGKEHLGWSNKTFANYRQYIITFLECCRQFGYISKNPAREIKKPRLSKSLPRFLTSEQIHKLLRSVQGIQWKSQLALYRNMSIIYLYTYTGMRLSELLKLRAKDVDLSNRQILIREGKGRKDRIVPIHSKIVGILRGYLDLRNQKLQPSDWFITGLQSSYRLYPKDIYQVCKRVSKASGVVFTPHQLRHSLGRMAVENNFSLYKLQKLLGHASISTTQIYLSASPENMQESFQEIDFEN